MTHAQAPDADELSDEQKLAFAIRKASYDFWFEKETLGCDSRGEEEAAYIAAKVLGLVREMEQQ